MDIWENKNLKPMPVSYTHLDVYKRQVIDTALRAALHEAFKTHTIMEAWGSSNEEMRNIPMNQTLLNYVKNSKQLQEIARLLGRYRELIADKRKNSYSYGRGEKYDLTTGNDITNCLSSELALLGMAETEILFLSLIHILKKSPCRSRCRTRCGRNMNGWKRNSSASSGSFRKLETVSCRLI